MAPHLPVLLSNLTGEGSKHAAVAGSPAASADRRAEAVSPSGQRRPEATLLSALDEAASCLKGLVEEGVGVGMGDCEGGPLLTDAVCGAVEEAVRQRAHWLFCTTGEANARSNWLAAERSIAVALVKRLSCFAWMQEPLKLIAHGISDLQKQEQMASLRAQQAVGAAEAEAAAAAVEVVEAVVAEKEGQKKDTEVKEDNEGNTRGKQDHTRTAAMGMPRMCRRKSWFSDEYDIDLDDLNEALAADEAADEAVAAAADEAANGAAAAAAAAEEEGGNQEEKEEKEENEEELGAAIKEQENAGETEGAEAPAAAAASSAQATRAAEAEPQTQTQTQTQTASGSGEAKPKPQLLADTLDAQSREARLMARVRDRCQRACEARKLAPSMLAVCESHEEPEESDERDSC